MSELSFLSEQDASVRSDKSIERHKSMLRNLLLIYYTLSEYSFRILFLITLELYLIVSHSIISSPKDKSKVHTVSLFYDKLRRHKGGCEH